MRFIGNIIWFLLGGFINSLLWFLGGLVLCITIVGIPFGMQCFKFAKLNFAPFGKEVNIHFDRHPIVNFIWLVFFGIGMAASYLVSGILNCITIVGIPFGIQSFKFMKLALLPFGAEVR